MTITSSLNAGVMGLNVNATRLAAISNNIANSATYGYKRADVNFTSLVVNQSASVYSAGGVQAQAIRNVSDAGSLISTGRATDIAVNGGGMIPVTNVSGLTQPGAERDFMMVPTGAFKPDAEGYLRTESGLYLLGWEMDANGDPVTGSRSSTTGLVPVNTTAGQFAAEVTNRINLSLNLPGDLSLAPVGETFDLPIEYFDQLGLPQTLNANFTRNAGDWSVVINDRSTGAPVQVAAFDVQFNANGTLDTITPGAGAAYNTTSGNVSLTLPSGLLRCLLGRRARPVDSARSGPGSRLKTSRLTDRLQVNFKAWNSLRMVHSRPSITRARAA
jgi:flagellar hook protein FlgE